MSPVPGKHRGTEGHERPSGDALQSAGRVPARDSPASASATRLWLCLYLPRLDARLRERASELDALHRLATWATRFTPQVSVETSGALLLEVAGSLELFGGLDALRAGIVSGTIARGHVPVTAVAPTARASLWLGRAGQESPVTDFERLPGALARLPVNSLDWPVPVCQALQRMGVRQLGECVRLPRDGLRRRIGESCLVEIDEAFGRRPEPREFFIPPDRFRDEIELPAETRESDVLMQALHILLGRFRDCLRARQAGAWVIWIRLRHQRLPATLLRIGLLRPSADVAHLGQLVAIHLSAVTVPAPVLGVELAADVAEAPPVPVADLLGHAPDGGASMAGFVERLRMRFGLKAVHGIRAWNDHRPECAWQAVADPFTGNTPGAGAAVTTPRPLWMLAQPEALNERSGAPCFHGPLVLDNGPERIETGWWDGRDVRRDYYVACNPRGTRAWVFRDLRTGGWYLHGLFG